MRFLLAPHVPFAPKYLEDVKEKVPFVLDPSLSCFRGLCVAVADGDTVLVLARGGALWVRLAGVDAAERGRPTSPTGQRWAIGQRVLSDLVKDRIVWGQWDPLQPQTDRYGRAIVYLGRFDDLLDVCRTSIELGGARAWVRGVYARRDEFKLVELEAREARRGVWSLFPSPERSEGKGGAAGAPMPPRSPLGGRRGGSEGR